MSNDVRVDNVDAQQVNAALRQRVAGRDYFEYFVPGSIKLALAMTPKRELDALALDNPNLFRLRFGFEAPTPVRRDILDIQNRFDLTDREIRRLRQAGHLTITRTEARLTPSRFSVISGWVQLLILSAFFIAMEIMVAYSSAPAWRLALGQVVVSSLWLGLMWGLNTLYIVPWRILRNAGAVPS